jgi:hypothetical protein
MSERETYLGDGLYCSFDGFAYTLRAPRGIEGDHSTWCWSQRCWTNSFHS